LLKRFIIFLLQYFSRFHLNVRLPHAPCKTKLLTKNILENSLKEKILDTGNKESSSKIFQPDKDIGKELDEK